jgi:hypothetical protein
MGLLHTIVTANWEFDVGVAEFLENRTVFFVTILRFLLTADPLSTGSFFYRVSASELESDQPSQPSVYFKNFWSYTGHSLNIFLA